MRCEGKACASDGVGGVESFLSFVYVDKIAGFFLLLCHRCHCSLPVLVGGFVVGGWGLLIKG